jgi:hypothetical protein
MTNEEFNSLPLEARNFIQKNSGCIACGNSANKLTRAYQLYKETRKMQTYSIKGGGINFQQGEEKGILIGIKAEDSVFQITEKIKIAKLVYASSPHVFSHFDENAMDKLLESLEVEVVQLQTELTPAQKGLATKAAKKAALMADEEAEDLN